MYAFFTGEIEFERKQFSRIAEYRTSGFTLVGKIIETFEKKTAGFAHKHRRVFFKARRLLRILSKANNQPYDWGNDLNTPFPSVIARIARVLPSADSKATEA